MSNLDSARRRELRAAAHHLHPVASIASKGLTDAVIVEIERALQAHELIKVKAYGADREQREAWMAEICQRLQCAPVQHIGTLLVLWRERLETPVSPALRTPEAAPAAPVDNSLRRPAAHAKSARAFAAQARRTALMARKAALAARTGRGRTPRG